MNKTDKINALKPLKSQFNKLNTRFDRILRYPDTERKNIKSSRDMKIFKIIIGMCSVFNEMVMIVKTPMSSNETFRTNLKTLKNDKET